MYIEKIVFWFWSFSIDNWWLLGVVVWLINIMLCYFGMNFFFKIVYWIGYDRSGKFRKKLVICMLL